MRIQHNIPALNTYRQLGINNTGSAKALEKLSSGYKINRAGDDAAGLAISEKMRAQIRGLNRASLNAQDGISLIQSAEGALQESQNILQRMRELAIQAGNDTNEAQDRTYIQDEINQLVKELDRIAFTTEFNKKTLLDGSLQAGNWTAKTVSGSGVKAGMMVDNDFVTGMYSIETTTLGTKAVKEFTVNMTGAIEGETVSISVGQDVTAIDGSTKLLTSGGVTSFIATGNVQADTSTAVNFLKDALSEALGSEYEVTSSGNTVIITSKNSATVTAEKTAYDTMNALTFSTKATTSTGGTGTAPTGVTAGTSTSATLAVVNFNGAAATASATKYGEYSAVVSGKTIKFNMEDISKYSLALIEVSAGRDLTLQVGANYTIDQTVRLGVSGTSSAILGVDNLSVHNNEGARASLASVDKALIAVSDQRAALGAVQNRLEHTILNLDTISENLADAESRIRDTDIAKEMMNFTKFSILMQSSQAMLAQANALPQGVLQLLR